MKLLRESSFRAHFVSTNVNYHQQFTWKNIKIYFEKLDIKSISPVTPTVKRIDHLHLTVGGGVLIGEALIRHAFSLLRSVGLININQSTKNDDMFYLHNDLINRIIIFNPTARVLPTQQTAWVNFLTFLIFIST